MSTERSAQKRMRDLAQRRLITSAAACVVLAITMAHANPTTAAAVSRERVDWPSYGGNWQEQHYSPLDSINAANVSRLGLVWSQDLPLGNTVTQPIEADGKVFTATGYSVVSAFDAVTGKLLWRYDPHVAEVADYKLREGWGSRGLASADRRVYVGTLDGRLIALDARRGTLVWSVLTTQPGTMSYITGAPRVFAGKVIIGFAGDIAAARSYVSCYDARTGRLLWRFYTVPGNPDAAQDGAASDSAMAIARKTWYGEWWMRSAGSAAVWNAITYDRKLNRFYIGTGSGFAVNQDIRSEGRGDNLFVASVVALDADTGRYLWHYQFNPGDEWDYDASEDLTLATLRIHGAWRRVLMQASKNGFFYVIDRTDGKLISAEPFAKENWAARIDLNTGRPIENRWARYQNDTGMVTLWPSFLGAHSWLPASYSPQTGLVYIPVIQLAMKVGDLRVDPRQWKAPVHGVSSPEGAGVMADFDPNLPDSGKSFLEAWDPVAQQLRWRRELPGDWPGGTLSTGGNLVFQGRLDHRFIAYSAQSGELLWNYDARSPGVAPPISFSVDGRQYITVLTGNGTSGGGGPLGPTLAPFGIDYLTMPRRVLTFALGGTKVLPPAPPPLKVVAPPDPSYRQDKALATRGMIEFMVMNCWSCHGFGAIPAGSAPDLRVVRVLADDREFESIVRGGALVPFGMPKFDDISKADLEAIRQYLRSVAQALPGGSAAGSAR